MLYIKISNNFHLLFEPNVGLLKFEGKDALSELISTLIAGCTYLEKPGRDRCYVYVKSAAGLTPRPISAFLEIASS